MKKSYLKFPLFIIAVILMMSVGLTGCFGSSAVQKAAESIAAEMAELEKEKAALESAKEASRDRPVVDTSSETAETAEAIPSYQLSGRDMMILAQPAVAFVITFYSAWVYDPNFRDYYGPYYSDTYWGSGFCINPNTGHVLTAGHVIDISEVDVKWWILEDHVWEVYGAEAYNNLTNEEWNWIYNNYKVVGDRSDSKLDQEIWIQFNAANSGRPDQLGDQFMRAELIDFSPWEQRDLAILRIQSVTGGALSSVMIADSKGMEVLDDVTIIGYPFTSMVGQDNILTPTVTTGRVSGKMMIGGTEVLQIQGDARGGNSGGPVLSSSSGLAIGMLTMGTDDTNNFLRPSSDMLVMLNRNGVTNELGMVDQEFKQGLINFRMGNYQEAINSFNAVLNLNQRHFLAQDYRSQAQRGATSTTTSN